MTPQKMTNTILLKCSLSINRYIKEIRRFDEDVACPCCGRRMRVHGEYPRTIVFKRRNYTIPVLRRRCPRCDMTFSLVPCFMIPLMRFANHIREFVGRWLLKGRPLAHLPDRLVLRGISIVSLRTLYRWKAWWRERWDPWFVKQRTLLASELEEGDGILALYREGMNSEQEREALITFFLKRPLLRQGTVLTRMNLQLPPDLRW